MRSIKKYGIRGVAVSVVLVAALALLLGTSQLAQAAPPETVDIVLTGDDNLSDDISVISVPTATEGPRTVTLTIGIEDDVGGSDDTIVTVSTTGGIFQNGLSAIVLQCGLDDVFDGSEGSECVRVTAYLTVPVGVSAGSIIITATTLNGVSGAEALRVTAAGAAGGGTPTSLSLKSDAASISGAGGSPDTGAKITITPMDKDGVKTNLTGGVILTTDLGYFDTIGEVEADDTASPQIAARTECDPTTNEGRLVIIPFTDDPSGTAWLCAADGDLGDATVTARGVSDTLTEGSVGVVMSGALSSIAIALDGDLGIGRDVVVTATATATDSDGRPAADAYVVSLIARPTAICEDTQVAAEAIGPDGAVSTLVIAVGASGNCIVRATSGSVVGVLAEVVEATAAPTETAPPDVDEEPTAEMVVGFMGEFPTSGFATVTFTGSIADLKAALVTGCPGGAPIYGSVVVDGVGSLVPYFPTTTLSAPNAAFEAAFAGGLSGTPLIAGNCGS